MTTLTRRERTGLCDFALDVGPDAPTLCGDWTARDLVIHLLVRERSLLGAPGIVIPALAGMTRRETDRIGGADFATLVARLRDPGFTPFTLPGIDQVANTVEFFVHHEDLRRAQPEWAPRPLRVSDQTVLWRALSVMGRALVRPAGVPVVIRRTDTDGSVRLRRGADPVTISALPSEIVMFLYGRRQYDGVEFTGPAPAIAALTSAELGI